VFGQKCLFVWGIFLLALVSSNLAADIHFDGQADDGLWSTATNWSNDNVPTAADSVKAIVEPGYGPAINSLTAEANFVDVGAWGWDGELTITSNGSLAVDTDLTIAVGSQETGVFNCYGEVSIDRYFIVGAVGSGLFNMYDGNIDVGTQMNIATDTGLGHVSLHGGTITSDNLGLNGDGTCTMDITQGTLIAAGDHTGGINWLASAGVGLFTGYGGWGTVLTDYNNINPGKTTVWAVDGTPSESYIYWDNGGLTSLWTIPHNWNGNKYPHSVHNVVLTPENASGQDSPLIQDGIDAQAKVLILGSGSDPDTPKLNMTGGSLTTADTFYIGFESRGTFNISGGVVNTLTSWLIVGHDGAAGSLNITGGTINADQITVGYYSGTGNISMAEGSIACNTLVIADACSIGHLDLNGGTITADSFSMHITNASMDIIEGTLILDGDQTALIDYITGQGVLTGYGDSDNIVYDYNTTYPDKTTVTASIAQPCSVGDLNNNCAVGLADLRIFIQQWLDVSGCSGTDCADFDGIDGVNFYDYALLAQNWRKKPAPLPRIAAQANQSDPVLYNTQTTVEFTPTGSNYIPLDWIEGTPYHTTFTTGHYDSIAAEASLAKMQQDGYNVARVFIDRGDSTHQALGQYSVAGPWATNTSDLYQPFLDNFIDFLRRARRHNIYVIPTCGMWPHNIYYETLAGSNIPVNVENVNLIILAQSAIDAKGLYLSKLVEAVKNAEPSGRLLSTVLAWELSNEISVNVEWKPFSLETGTVTPADGITYDMSLSGDRQQCMDSGMIRWTNQLVAHIKSVDPDAMVSLSVFTYNAVGKAGPNGVLPRDAADVRFPARPWSLLAHSTLSYVDVHMYPAGPSYSIDDDLASSEYSIWDLNAKPIVMGEFGAFKSYYPDINNAASAMETHRQNAFDRGFTGALFWTWESNGQHTLWHMLDEGGVINDTLKP